MNDIVVVVVGNKVKAFANGNMSVLVWDRKLQAVTYERDVDDVLRVRMLMAIREAV